MNVRTRFAATALSITLVISIAAPAVALGRRTEPCNSSGSYVGESNSTYAETWQNSNLFCGDMGVRARYKTYEGSPVYLSSWKWGQKSARSTPGNIMVGGDHQAPGAGWAFVKSFST